MVFHTARQWFATGAEKVASPPTLPIVFLRASKRGL